MTRVNQILKILLAIMGSIMAANFDADCKNANFNRYSKGNNFFSNFEECKMRHSTSL